MKHILCLNIHCAKHRTVNLSSALCFFLFRNMAEELQAQIDSMQIGKYKYPLAQIGTPLAGILLEDKLPRILISSLIFVHPLQFHMS